VDGTGSESSKMAVLGGVETSGLCYRSVNSASDVRNMRNKTFAFSY
jgi:hypothetical protein